MQKPSKSIVLVRRDLCGGFYLRGGGAIALADALAVNSTLKRLCLSNNCLEEAGTKALATALAINTTLQELEVGRALDSV